MPTATTTFRFKTGDLARFRAFHAELQAQSPGTVVTQTDALRAAVSSASAALAKGELRVALAFEPTQPQASSSLEPRRENPG